MAKYIFAPPLHLPPHPALRTPWRGRRRAEGSTFHPLNTSQLQTDDFCPFFQKNARIFKVEIYRSRSSVHCPGARVRLRGERGKAVAVVPSGTVTVILPLAHSTVMSP